MTLLARLTVSALVMAVLPASAQEASQPIRRLPSAPESQVSLHRRVSIAISSRPLREAIPIVEQLSGLRIQAMWLDERTSAGLDPEMPVSISAHNEPILRLIERLIESADLTGGSTWQFSSSGALQIGPRVRLNIFRRVQVYDVTDLLKETPDHRVGPSIDLQQAFQNSGQSAPIIEPAESRQEQSEDDRAADLADLIRATVETEQWRENGGDGGWIQPYRRVLIVNAPDYIHRAIAGRK